jgi:hypothetical protein
MITVWIGTRAREAISVSPGLKASTGHAAVRLPSGKQTSWLPSRSVWTASRHHGATGVVADVAGEARAAAEEQVAHQLGLHDADAARQVGDDDQRVEHARVVGGDDEAAPSAASASSALASIRMRPKASALAHAQRWMRPIAARPTTPPAGRPMTIAINGARRPRPAA